MMNRHYHRPNVRYVRNRTLCKVSTLASKINDSMCTPLHSHHIKYPSRTHTQAIRIPIQSEPKLKTCPVTQGNQSKAKVLDASSALPLSLPLSLSK